MVDSLFTFFFLLLEAKSFTNRHSFARDESPKAIFSVSRFIFIFCATLNSRSRFCSWSFRLRIITSITSSLFLISKFSRITSLQSLFFNFLESNVLLSLGQCINCFLVSKTIRVFSHSHIALSITLSEGLRCTYLFSGVPSIVLTLCALRMVSREGCSVTNHWRLAFCILPMTLGPAK